MGAILFNLPQARRTADRLVRLHGLHPDARLCLLELEVEPFTAPETAEEILCAWGPFYLCRFRHAMADAVLVSGVNTDSGSLYCLPCDEGRGAGTVRIQPYGEWIARWRNRCAPFKVLVAPCRQRAQRWQGLGGCAHAAQAVRLKQADGSRWAA